MVNAQALVYGQLLLLVLLLIPSTLQENSEYVCGSIDLRNTVQNFNKLQNCTVIEGFLRILLIDDGSPAIYDSFSFPKLREITGYVLLYRTRGLLSLSKLFPNLAVIRGYHLFHNYALVVFEMFHLQELGLTSLTDILRGSVRIEKNAHLCYMDTIDWGRIVKTGKEGNFFKNNLKVEECQKTCPNQSQCVPKLSNKSTQTNHCWNSYVCQKVCPARCEEKNLTCASDGICCHEECLGGCNGPSEFDCSTCRHVSYGGKCLKKCPENTYMYLGRRCITREECHALGNETSVFWKTVGGKCVEECPAGYTEATTNRHICQRCITLCPKVCDGGRIDSVAGMQSFRGCTIIRGRLEIQVRGGVNVAQELEENLNSIQEITDYLKIARSFPLITLDFLKNLTVIHGEILEKNEYALVILDNQNLQSLWNWDLHSRKLQIKRGKVFFHFNSKLCPSRIEELKEYANVVDWDSRDVSPVSNGDKVACDVKSMNVSLYDVNSTFGVIKWQNLRYTLEDPDSLLGYVLYYREAPVQNITRFDGRDTCGTDVWKVVDVEVSEVNYIYHPIMHLKPFTQYGVYIRTYTTASGRQGAQSPLIFFKTLADTPSTPLSLRAFSTLSSEIVINWLPPQHPNGRIAHYVVEGFKNDRIFQYFGKNDYCSEKNFIPIQQTKSHFESLHYHQETSTSSPSSECCTCPRDQAKYLEEIKFDEYILNNFNTKEQYNLFGDRTFLKGNETRFSGPEKFRQIVHHTYLVVSKLDHFSEYIVQVKACLKSNPNPQNPACSSQAITVIRTQALEGADDLDNSLVTITRDNGSVVVSWDEPFLPNGPIQAYQLRYMSLSSISASTPVKVCLTNSQFLTQQKQHELFGIGSGNYSIQIRALSMAGQGNWSKAVYFYIAETSNQVDSGSILLISMLIVLGLLILVMLTLYLIFKTRLLGRQPNEGILYASVNPEYMSANIVYEPDEWEVSREDVALIKELGQGSFGMVYEGEALDANSGNRIKCAVKTVNDSANLRERIEFLQEASVMKAFNCHHVVKLLGVVSKGQPTLVLMELMPNGDLKSYLRSCRRDLDENPSGKDPPTLQCILQMAAEIADGMAYLTAKKFVHRDLAARNCMVAEDLTVKIGDFGMTRDIYETDYYRKGGKGLLPVRWMSPESLKDGIFTCQSDVWSFGVVLWEMATLASQPYQGLSNEQVLQFVIAGNLMEKPEGCPDRLYGLMKLCWMQYAKLRPTFIELVEILLPSVGNKFSEFSFYHSLPPPQDEQQQPPDEGAEAYDLLANISISNGTSQLSIAEDIKLNTLTNGHVISPISS